MDEQSKKAIVEAARELAQWLHCGQTDKAGLDYFATHLTTVARSGATWQEQVVGYLHDAAEDTPHTVEEVLRLLQARLANGPSDDLTPAEWGAIGEALHLMNAHTAPSREAYIRRFRGHRLAILVKLNDLRHNMDITRIPHPTEKDRARVERYRKELELLMHYLEEMEVGGCQTKLISER